MRFEPVIAVCLFLLVATGSCDLLKTRDPQPPDQQNTANPLATSPQILIDNLQAAFANKNLNDYGKIFADVGSVGKQYVFIPTQKAEGNYTALFSQWTTESEMNYFRKAMASVSTAFIPSVSFSNVVLTPFQSDSALYETDYTVFLTPTTYVGHARFLMLPNKNTGAWVIYRWEDVQTSNNSSLSWSDMKGQFSQ
ncbi:MAG: hypothetical protein WBZ48_10540 [Bacteroidota bacterium]